MNDNFQGGDNKLYQSFYSLIFDFIHDGDKLLNLGCGIRFIFEKALSEEKRVEITSCDVLVLKEKPDCVANVINKTVEEELILDKKFDVVTFFEVIEHIDKTDMLLKNCFNNLKDDGYLIFSFPNLASIYSRIELLFGLQPHVLEVSNERGNFGTGFFGKYNNKSNASIHHIRGITQKAMREMVKYHGFDLIKIIGYEFRFKYLFYYLPKIAPINIFICRKKLGCSS